MLDLCMRPNTKCPWPIDCPLLAASANADGGLERRVGVEGTEES